MVRVRAHLPRIASPTLFEDATHAARVPAFLAPGEHRFPTPLLSPTHSRTRCGAPSRAVRFPAPSPREGKCRPHTRLPPLAPACPTPPNSLHPAPKLVLPVDE